MKGLICFVLLIVIGMNLFACDAETMDAVTRKAMEANANTWIRRKESWENQRNCRETSNKNARKAYCLSVKNIPQYIWHRSNTNGVPSTPQAKVTNEKGRPRGGAEDEKFVCVSACKAETKVRLRQAVAGNCPQDSCIKIFESLSRMAKQKHHPQGGVFVLAEDEGFEPPRTESESGVLPLH